MSKIPGILVEMPIITPLKSIKNCTSGLFQKIKHKWLHDTWQKLLEKWLKLERGVTAISTGISDVFRHTVNCKLYVGVG